MFTIINFTDFATLSGSPTSTASGLPVITLQNPQERVHILPKIIKVAVPAPQHSPILGQCPLSQMVCNLLPFTRDFTSYRPYLLVILPLTILAFL